MCNFQKLCKAFLSYKYKMNICQSWYLTYYLIKETVTCYEQFREHLNIYIEIEIKIDMKFDRLLSKLQNRPISNKSTNHNIWDYLFYWVGIIYISTRKNSMFTTAPRGLVITSKRTQHCVRRIPGNLFTYIQVVDIFDLTVFSCCDQNLQRLFLITKKSCSY